MLLTAAIAWLACATDASESSFVTLFKEQADAAARDWGWSVVPLAPLAAPKQDATPQQGSVQSRGSVQGWIPVTESNPCHGDAVWVYDGKDVFMGEWWGQSGFQSYGSSCDREGLNSETLLGVTHWMEIDEPEPPT